VSEPRRLVSDPEGATEFERELLESWSAEQPSAAARARALGIASVAAGSVLGAGAAAAAPKALSASLTKWLIVGLALAGATAAAVVALRHEPAPVAVVAPPVPAPPVPVAAPPATKEEPTIAIADLKSATPVAAPHAAVAPPAASGGTLAAEIAALDEARRSLRDGDPARTLAHVDAYERRFPAGAFTEEAEVLRIEALVRSGDRARAVAVGQRFLAARPTSPHAARIRAILPASTP
jgi:hypothetical protein